MQRTNGREGTRRFRWLGIWVFVFLVLSVIGTSSLYFLSQRGLVLQQAREELSSIAQLKVEEITSWMAERKQDAEVLRGSLLTLEDLPTFLRNPTDQSLKQKISQWLRFPQEQHHYKAIYLLNSEGKFLLSVGDDREIVGSYAESLALQAMKRKEVIFSDLHRLDSVGAIHIDLLVPLNISADDSPQAALLFRIDPANFLYPMIQSWPTSSQTGETLLFHVEGDEVVYLNELRHQKGTALSLRLPLNEEQLPSAMAARGARGVVEGSDYRGVAVVAAIQTIPDTSWFLIAKMDQAEIFRPLWSAFWVLPAFVGSFIIGAGAIITTIWQRRMRRYEYRQYRADIERQELAQRLEYLSKYANDVILLTDSEGNILEANDRALSAYGYSKEEIVGLNISALRSPQVLFPLEDRLKEISHLNGDVFESLHKRKDGTVFPVEVSARMIQLAGRQYFQGIVRDTSERKQAEEKISRLNRLYRLLSQINQTVIHARDKNELLKQACIIAVEEGKFNLAWVGLIEDVKSALSTVAVCGKDEGFLAKPPGYLAEMLSEWESTVRTLSEGNPQINNDLKDFLGQGYRSNAQFPLRQEGSVVGVISFFSDQVGFFNEQEIQLLAELSNDLSFALDHLEEEKRRKRVEEELRRERDFNQSLIQFSPIFFVAIDAEGKTLLMNDLMLSSLGYSKEEVIGQDYLSLFVPQEEHDSLKEVFRRLVKLKETTKNENHVRSKEGKELLVEWYGKPICKASGELDYFFGVGIDITERKQMEESLQKSEKQYRDLFENSPAGIYRTTPDGRVLLANPSFQRMTGYSIDELASINLEENGLESPPRSYFRETIEREGKIEGYESSWLRPDGNKIYVRENARVIRAPDGSVLYYEGTAEDVTLQKKAEGALQEEKKKLLQIFSTMRDGVCIISRDYELQFVNPVVERDFGPVGGRKCYDYFQGLGTPCEGCDNQEVLGGKSQQRELFAHKTSRVYEIYDAPFKNEDGGISKLRILHDITEKKRMEEEINKVRTDLLYSVSHELKTPLLNLMTAQELLQSLPPEKKMTTFLEHEELWQRSIRRLRNLINNLVDSQRIQEASIPLQPENCQLEELWQSVWQDQQDYVRVLSLSVIFEDEDGIPSLTIDREAIGRIMTNLFSNAVKFSPKNGTIKVRLWRDEEYAYFSVSDQGPGISPEEQKELFQPFQRSRLAVQKVMPGTGLGLYVARRLAEAHHGDIFLESKEGQGTTVTLRIPLQIKQELS